MLEYLQEISEADWKPVGLVAAAGWVLFYCAFLTYALLHNGEFLIIDNVNLVIHEGGHLLFSWMGPTMTLYGGTLLQWLVPLLLAAYFWTQRQTTAYVFSLFFFFENWLYTATYMADARAQALPLVGVGDIESSESMHDFYRIFSQLGVLEHDTQIAALVRTLGYIGMTACVAWLVWRARQTRSESQAS